MVKQVTRYEVREWKPGIDFSQRIDQRLRTLKEARHTLQRHPARDLFMVPLRINAKARRRPRKAGK